MSTTATATVEDATRQPAPDLRQAPPPPARRAPWRGLLRPSFLVAAGVLLAAAVGLNTATGALSLYFKKQPVPLPARLDDAERGLARELGPWVAVSKDEPLDADVEHILGTHEYVFRHYLDKRLVGQAVLDEFEGKTSDQRKAMVMAIQQRNPEAVVHVAVTYYTGLADTVAHIPDRCMVADGYEPKTYVTKSADVDFGGGRVRPVEYRFIHFQDQTGVRREDRSVAYFFHCNGEYDSSPRGVRLKLQNLFERHGYYAKVELMNTSKDEQKADAVMKDLLAHALPDVERCLPDWARVKAAAAAAQAN